MTRIQWLQNKLLEDGYRRIESNLPQFSVYYKKNQEQVWGIFLAEFTEVQVITNEQMNHICAQVYQMLQKVGGELNPSLLVLAAGKDIINYKSSLAELPNCWLWDSESGQLIIYENQPSQFYGLEKLLESNSPERKNAGNNRRNFHRPKVVANTVMVAVNVLVFLIMELMGSTEDTQFMLEHGAAYAPWILEYGEYYRLFTCMFMHFGISHLVNNMLVLFLLGDNVERAVGRWKYLAIYLLSGLTGSIFSFVGDLTSRSYAVSAGASGAVFGIIGALFYIVAVNRGRLEDMTTRRLGIMIVVSLYHGFTSSGVDNLAHIGGMIGGAVLAMALYRRKGTLYKKNDGK